MELGSSRRGLGSGERALFSGRSLQSPVDKRGRVARDAPLTTSHQRNLLLDYISFTGTLLLSHKGCPQSPNSIQYKTAILNTSGRIIQMPYVV
jgi:hypothetical protein